MEQLIEDNSSLVKALTMAALLDGEIVDEVRKIDIKDYKTDPNFSAVSIALNEIKILWKSLCTGNHGKKHYICNTIYPISQE